MAASRLNADVAFDPASNSLFWLQAKFDQPGDGIFTDGNAIGRASLDGTGAQIIVPDTLLTSPNPIYLDPLQGHIYWGENTGIFRANFDGTNFQTTTTAIPDGVRDFVLAPSGSQYVFPPSVPEPSTLSLFATGLAGLGFMDWRRRRPMQLKAA